MNSLQLFLVTVASLVFSLLADPAIKPAGLYADEAKKVTGGDLKDQDYWWAKFDAMMLEVALKQHQPEGPIGLNLVGSINRLDELSTKYPKHEDLKKWKQRAEEVQKKIDTNADRRQPFGPSCPWNESNYAQLWVNLHRAQFAWQARDYALAKLCLQNVLQNYEFMMKPDRMKDYPDDLRKWVVDSKPGAELLYQKVKYKLHEGPAPPTTEPSANEPATTRPSAAAEKDISPDDLKDQDYWWARFDAMMLELAIQEHQPEGRIGVDLASSIRRLDELIKKYPKQENLKKWKQRAEEVQAKIDPDASRSEYLSPECPWEESNFAQLWVNLHCARVAAAEKDFDLARLCLQNVMQNYPILLAPDRMKDYPDDLRDWVVNSKPGADELYKQVKAHR